MDWTNGLFEFDFQKSQTYLSQFDVQEMMFEYV